MEGFTLNVLHLVIGALLGVAFTGIVSRRVAITALLVLLMIDFQLEAQPRPLIMPSPSVAVSTAMPTPSSRAPTAPASPAAPSPTPPGGQLVSGCPAPPTTMSWLISDAPKGRATLTIDQPACSTLVVTSGGIRATSGWTCGNAARQQCVFLNRTGPVAQRTTITVDANHVWYGISSVSPDRVIANMLAAMLAPPNCETGCSWATIGSHEDARFQGERRSTQNTAGTPGLPAGATPTKLYVDAQDQTGAASYIASKTGFHDVRITCGAYSPWAKETPDSFWRSVVYGYVGGSLRWVPRWGHLEPGDPDIEVGLWEGAWGRTRAAIESASAGLGRSVFLKAGDRMTFTTIDEQGHPYSDNRGGVCLEVNPPGVRA